MDTLCQLELYASDLAIALSAFASSCRANGASTRLPLFSEAPTDIVEARRAILSKINRIQTLLTTPTDFLQRLATHNQLLACLQWLGEFQILACIPLNGSVSIGDVAALSRVPEMELSRIIRMAATAGFLKEPQPGEVAHTALSSPFVARKSYLDAAMFLAGTVAPVSLRMTGATHRHGAVSSHASSAYSLAFGTPQTFEAACRQQPKLQRQLAAFIRCMGNEDDIIGMFRRLDWRKFGPARIVEVGGESLAVSTVLAALYPELHFVVQVSRPDTDVEISSDAKGSWMTTQLTAVPPSCHVTVEERDYGSPQMVRDAAVYIIRLDSMHLGRCVPSSTSPQLIVDEMKSHLRVLSFNVQATAVVMARLLPEPATVDPSLEALARLRDLSLYQLSAQEREMEVAELVKVIESVHDNTGQLAVLNKLTSHSGTMVLLAVKYQPNPTLAGQRPKSVDV